MKEEFYKDLSRIKIIKTMYRFSRTIIRRFIFFNDYLSFSHINKSKGRFRMNWRNRWPCLNDNTTTTGFDRHYIYHTAWASRVVRRINPKIHIDISSSLYFCSILSAFVPVEFYDYRPAPLVLPGLISGKADLTKLFFEDNSISSLSCMHTVEHIGLGRYGDDIDYDGDLKAMRELARVLAVNGNLLFVVPVGSQSIIQYNAHRIYTKDSIVEAFQSLGLNLKEFTFIPENEDDGSLVLNPSEQLLSSQKYGCGCFLFTK
jgi:hypothetical protein